jgi:ferredoxin-NADP reductase
MLKAHARRDDSSPLLWIHSTRDGSTHVLRREVDPIVRANRYFGSHVLYTSPRLQDRAGVDYDASGRLTPQRLGTLLGGSYKCRPFGREIELPGQAGLFYICGPESFERMTRQALTDLGVDPTAIHSERFSLAISRSAPVVERCEVRFTRSSRTGTWSHEQDFSLLELAEQQGIVAPFSCRTGTCHTCETRLISGKISYDVQPPVAPGPGRVLICCARPDAATLELDL